MKAQILSDLHIEFDDFDIKPNDSDIVILAGDIHVKDKGVHWALERIVEKPVLYVLGNHEFYGKAYPKHVASLKALTEGTNVSILEKDTVSLNGVNFMGCTLWTDFELFGDPRLAGYECQQVMTDFKKIRLSPKFSKIRSIDVSSIHRQSLNWLKDQLKVYKGQTNVVITHHGPSVRSLPDHKVNDITSASYVSNLESVAVDFSPCIWVHGHMHNSSNYKLGDCQVICNPRGYPDKRNPNFNTELLVEINSV